MLITGATGLLGSWLTKALVERGAFVVALIRDWLPENELFGSGMLKRVWQHLATSAIKRRSNVLWVSMKSILCFTSLLRRL